MGSISDFLEDAWLDHVLKTATYTRGTTLYVGLSIADPLDDASGMSEPVGNNYAREALTDASWVAAAARSTNYNALITFNQASGSWGTISHYFICNHLSNTNWGTDVDLIAHGSLNVSKAVVNGNTPSIAAAEIVISLNAGGITTYLANEMLDHTFRDESLAVPTNVCIALCTADPGDGATGDNITEPAGNNYSRCTHNAWDTAAAGASENTGVAQFAVPSGSWGLITHVCLCDAATSGNALFHGTATPNQTPDNGDDVEYADGDLDISIT
jgi:hypothetical protein